MASSSDLQGGHQEQISINTLLYLKLICEISSSPVPPNEKNTTVLWSEESKV